MAKSIGAFTVHFAKQPSKNKSIFWLMTGELKQKEYYITSGSAFKTIKNRQ